MRLVLGLGLTYSLVFRGWNGGSVGGKNLIPRRFLLFLALLTSMNCIVYILLACFRSSRSSICFC